MSSSVAAADSAPRTRVLAWETSGLFGSVAALAGGTLLLERPLPTDRRSAQTLHPTLQAVLAQVGWRLCDVELLGVLVGPGSFTGVRVGVVTAKTLAYACGAAVVGVDSLLATVARCSVTTGAVVEVAFDALRGDVFAAAYRRTEDGAWAVESSPALLSMAAWQDRVAGRPAGTQATGLAAGNLAADLPAGITLVPEALRSPTAAVVGALAFERYQRGAVDDCWKLQPLYLRQAAAEEKLAARPGR